MRVDLTGLDGKGYLHGARYGEQPGVLARPERADNGITMYP
ncbi:MAG TPA: hypothetical protein VML19_14045 [Verrucomicrobiae bacterium]|nr:hypothetical protein [Verrucomicrobiae bacterium]